MARLVSHGWMREEPRRDAAVFPEPRSLGLPSVEPKLATGLQRLSEHQRVCVVLVHGFGWTHRETAEFLGLSRSSVQNHVERGLESLRQTIGAYDDA